MGKCSEAEQEKGDRLRLGNPAAHDTKNGAAGFAPPPYDGFAFIERQHSDAAASSLSLLPVSLLLYRYLQPFSDLQLCPVGLSRLEFTCFLLNCTNHETNHSSPCPILEPRSLPTGQGIYGH